MLYQFNLFFDFFLFLLLIWPAEFQKVDDDDENNTQDQGFKLSVA